MKLSVCGGVGEHGRNCFHVELGAHRFFVDCGRMAGAEMPWPRVTAQQAREAQALFLTHSHKDHAGALPWLRQMGFRGQVLAAGETLVQLQLTAAPGCTALERLSRPGENRLMGEMLWHWGRAGHCPGSVWYWFGAGEHSILFSGDYTEDGLCWECDPIRRQVADLAVLDCAYGADPRSPAQLRREFQAALGEDAPVLLPVPRYGRGLEMALLVHWRFPCAPLWGDAHFLAQLAHLPGNWLKREAEEALETVEVLPAGDDLPREGFRFVCSPQLEGLEQLAENYLQAGGRVILTGNADDGSASQGLLAAGRAEMRRVSVHMNRWQMLDLARKNRFGALLPYHSRGQW